ncbi:hypothetical protein C3747_89g801c [Trypanosoma cruzi]|uniref:Succinate dehydrogenase assembly factor 2, mitochondrial n=2 Tax=Trypanosoma cruzi TaxID=5693 RepID=Q4DG04_TRYCC|nr:hypothetical protein, conserved [Trypanosoma cruzi]EAN91469.1 hypothetical protein, conserved [Trypanosoma cruzi]PWV08484.1 hypothetical protein C3747_89g801c [Trypanosoma cruzi]RNC49412.1 hypothetical protein TcCL_NonESM00639 [Trypanosoma cruzi]|eukprot:XP_813320.1 hypothetical protein [Trypanosoma cruzi strain CL Brener]
MLRRFSRRLAPRAKHHDELVKMWRESPRGVDKASEESGLRFRDTRPTPQNEPDDAKRRRLIYQSAYRGMVEMDIILGAFSRHSLEGMPREQLDEYDTILRHFDSDLFKWLVMDEKPPASVACMSTYKVLQEFVKGGRERLLGQAV